MELTSDLISIQGLLLSIVKNTGSFLKIVYKGGNEMKILEVTKELEGLLESKHYLIKRKCVKAHLKELESITFFLMINSQLKNDQYEMIPKEYSNLTNVTPQISQCLLANVVTELGLIEPYCGALHLIPIELWETLLAEMIPCVKKSPPELSIEYSCLFIKNIIIKISSLNVHMKDIISPLDEIVKQLLLNCSSITLKAAQGLKKSQIYNLMGLSILSVLKLLLACQVNNELLFATIVNLINTATSLVTVVTLDVYCSWADAKHGDVPLQLVIGEAAYKIIEKYQNFEHAQEFLKMLSSISRKPRTISEQIQTSDTATIIRKVFEDSENRSKWFKALLATNIFSNPASMNCLKEHYQLCTLEDLYYILKTLLYNKTTENVDLFIECTQSLNNHDLISLLVRHYYQNGLTNNLEGDKRIMDELICILNQMNATNSSELNRDIVLLLFREPKIVLKHLYKECIRNSLFVKCLTDTLMKLADFAEIEGLFLVILEEILEEIKLNNDNLESYQRLFKVICKKPSSCNKIISEIFKPYCFEYLEDNNLEDLRFMFTLYLNVDLINLSEEEQIEILKLCGLILENCRWIIYNFSTVKVELCLLSSEYLILHHNEPFLRSLSIPKHELNTCYLSNINQEGFYDQYVSAFRNESNQGNRIAWLLKVLPICLIKELTIITHRLIQILDEIKVLDLYVTVLILISELVQTQPEEGSQNIVNGFKYCLGNFGHIVKNLLLPLNQEDINVEVAKKIGKLLNHLPPKMEDVEGFSLAALIPEGTLKNLAKNKQFLEAVKGMKYQKVAISIVKRMLK